MPAAAANPAWERWQSIPGIFDIAGPRSDGSLVVAGSAMLYLVDPSGSVIAFARGSQGYADDAGTEAYLTMSAGHEVTGAGCSFAADDVFALRLHTPLGITRIDSQGKTIPFATVAGVDSLNGITFDNTGNFGYRLLATGATKGKTTIVAIDCNGTVQLITSTAPVLEGGLDVAPAGFGAFAGDLIAPDELSGKIYAIGPDGKVSLLAASGLPAGQDIGIESLAFVPPGLITRGGDAYYSDRATPNNPHPGTDSLLRLSATDLAAAGVHDGDLLGATEGGASMIAVSCQTKCQVSTVVGTPTTSHGEGHIAFSVTPIPRPAGSPAFSVSPARTPSKSQPALMLWPYLTLLGVALAIALLLVRRRLARRS
jgi:hypothetical protein